MICHCRCMVWIYPHVLQVRSHSGSAAYATSFVHVWGGVVVCGNIYSTCSACFITSGFSYATSFIYVWGAGTSIDVWGGGKHHRPFLGGTLSPCQLFLLSLCLHITSAKKKKKMGLSELWTHFYQEPEFHALKNESHDGDEEDIESENLLPKMSLSRKSSHLRAWICLTIANVIILCISIFLVMTATRSLSGNEKNTVLRPVSWWCKSPPPHLIAYGN